jgi:hypothetical protein
MHIIIQYNPKIYNWPGNNVNMQNTLCKEFAVIDWEDKDSVSVVSSSHVAYGVFHIGDVCRVWTPEGTFRGRVSASGERKGVICLPRTLPS